MGQNAAVELNYVMIFFSYGILCGFLYHVIDVVCKILHTKKIIGYIVDCIYVTCCYIPFFHYYVNELDGILHFYQAIFFVVGLVFYFKYIAVLDRKVIIFSKRSCPKKLKDAFMHIKNILYK